MSTVPVSTTSGPCSDAVTFANFLLSSALWTSASMPPASAFAVLAPTPNQSDALSTATPAANRLSLLNLNIRSSFPTENSTPTQPNPGCRLRCQCIGRGSPPEGSIFSQQILQTAAP